MGLFEFDRYIDGSLMAEGVTIERQTTLDAAMREAARIASKGPHGETPVLVLRAHPSTAPENTSAPADELEIVAGTWAILFNGTSRSREKQTTRLAGFLHERLKEFTRDRAARSDQGAAEAVEAFIQAAVDQAPEPLRRLGRWLSEKLDEDDWKTAERMLLGAAALSPREATPARPEADDERVRREAMEEYEALDRAIRRFERADTECRRANNLGEQPRLSKAGTSYWLAKSNVFSRAIAVRSLLLKADA